ncbi:GNAT family N-acetyltransferase [Arthrospiribacter ruber]|uniref:N-acetyltransferase n=1 Tax=Arthrospiribacter ruber TaxID=2487934 RepID=A0A951J206_9BACT|nr:GNAT family N-acetyltransferase [Arthrospiribacter ruber]MBW3469697.1 N-acetyltransferase [Arthrospiribacter ruber]
MAEIVRTERLLVRQLHPEDQDFILELLNSPDWMKYIGDRGVKDALSAQEYIISGPMSAYAKHGYGLFLLEEKESNKPLGLAGFLKRTELDFPDLGFALLPEAEGKGYAHEACASLINIGKENWGFTRLFAITLSENTRSKKLLTQLGFVPKGDFSFLGKKEKLELLEFVY